MEVVAIIAFGLVMLCFGICAGAAVEGSPHFIEMDEPYQPYDDVVKIDSKGIANEIKIAFDEYTSVKNVEAVLKFIDHYKTETGNEIPESVFNSFFNN